MAERMLVDLKSRHALVTGGGTGIGRALSIGLARCGATVVVNYSRSEQEANETVEEILRAGGQAIAVKADVTDENQVERLVNEAVQEFGGLEILVANAGGPTGTFPTDELSGEEWDKGLDLNCKSVFYCAKHALRHLPDGTGRIIVTSSISGRSGGAPGGITYAAAKGAIYNMVRSWAKEYGPRGITANAIAPGLIWTRIHKGGNRSRVLPATDHPRSPGAGRAAGRLRRTGVAAGRRRRQLHHRSNHRSQRRHADAMKRTPEARRPAASRFTGDHSR